MRVLYLADIRFPLERANGIQTMETCHALARRGHEISLGVRPDTARPPRDPFDYYGLDRIDALTICYARAWDCGAARRVCYVSQALHRAVREPWDIVLTRDLGLAALLLRVPVRRRPPVTYESHGFAPVVAAGMPQMLSGGKGAGWLKRRRLLTREKWVWNRADGYVTNTAGVVDELRARFGSRQLLAVIPNGVRHLPDGGETVPSPHHGSPIVGYAGHLYPWKGVDVLLRALAALPNVRGLIVGGSEAELDLARARQLSADLGLGDRVTFTGWVRPSEVPRLLRDAAILVVPNRSMPASARYTSPLKLFEYLALGKPVVASDLPALREILRDQENALLVPPDRPAALAAALRDVLEDSALAERLSRGAHVEAQKYTWDRRAERLEALLRAAIVAHSGVA